MGFHVQFKEGAQLRGTAAVARKWVIFLHWNDVEERGAQLSSTSASWKVAIGNLEPIGSSAYTPASRDVYLLASGGASRLLRTPLPLT